MNETAYLTAKRTVDDRSLNRRVLNSFSAALAERDQEEVRIVEIGAGTGTMPVRLAQWGVLPDRVTYRAVERRPDHVAAARERVPAQLASSGYDVDRKDRRTDGGFTATRGDQRLRIRFETGDAFDVDDGADALVACAFFDLVSLPEALVDFRRCLATDGLLYAPITFDGLTGFVPSHPLDGTITELYHRHMANRRPGGPNAGRELLETIPAVDGDVVAVGGSDWIVRPLDGSYPDDERLVVEYLLSTIHDAVSELDSLEQAEIDAWIDERQRQVDTGSLLFLAHNLDILCQFQ